MLGLAHFWLQSVSSCLPLHLERVVAPAACRDGGASSSRGPLPPRQAADFREETGAAPGDIWQTTCYMQRNYIPGQVMSACTTGENRKRGRLKIIELVMRGLRPNHDFRLTHPLLLIRREVHHHLSHQIHQIILKNSARAAVYQIKVLQ